jgi:hypothetical protein
MSRRSLLLVNSLFRLGYGVGALVAPSAMAAARMAPDTEDRPDARLFVRGFGAHQLAAGAMALGSLRWRRLERPAMVLALAIDALDMVSAAVEARARGQVDADVAGGLALSAAGAATAAGALRRRPGSP